MNSPTTSAMSISDDQGLLLVMALLRCVWLVRLPFLLARLSKSGERVTTLTFVLFAERTFEAPRSMESIQYVARPPERSNTAPVVNEHSSLASQQTSEVASSIVPNRPTGILDSMNSMCSGVI